MHSSQKLIKAAEQGDSVKVKEALIEGADINVMDNSHHNLTPLHWATMRGHTEVVKLLIENDADVNAKNIHGSNSTPLHLAASYNVDSSIIGLLVRAGADINAKDVNKNTPRDIARINKTPAHHHFIKSDQKLIAAAKANNLDEMKIAIANGADINAKDDSWFYFRSLHWAVQNKKMDIVKWLLDSGADVNAEDVSKGTAFQLTVKNNLPFEFGKVLADHGANIWHQDANNHTARQLANIYHPNGHQYFDVVDRQLIDFAKAGKIDGVIAAIKNGANVHAVDGTYFNYTSLHWAAGHAHASAVAFLINNGANPNTLDAQGYSPLDVAKTNTNSMQAQQILSNAGGRAIKTEAEIAQARHAIAMANHALVTQQHKKKKHHGGLKKITKPFNKIVNVANKLDTLSQKMTQPITKPVTKLTTPVLTPVLAPVSKVVAPINKVLNVVNPILTPVKILTGGGTLEQAAMAVIKEVVIHKVTAPIHNAINRIVNPLDGIVKDVLKPIEPITFAIRNTFETTKNVQKIANNLSPQQSLVPRSNLTVPQKKTSTSPIKTIAPKITSDLPIKTVVSPTKSVVSSRKPIAQHQIETKPIVQQSSHSSTASINTAMKSSQTGANDFKKQQREIMKHHREVNDIKLSKTISWMSDFTKLAENDDKGSLPEKIFCSGLGTAAQVQTQKVGMELTMAAAVASTIYTKNPIIGCTVAMGGQIVTPVVAEKVGEVVQSQCHQTLDYLKNKSSTDVNTSATKPEETQLFKFNMRK